MSGLIWPKIKLDQAFMSVLVTSNFDDDSIKHDQSSMETPFSHYKSLGNCLDAQGQLCWLVVMRLNVPVNNFSVISGRSHRFLGN